VVITCTSYFKIKNAYSPYTLEYVDDVVPLAKKEAMLQGRICRVTEIDRYC
jgi:hypothetical protein